MALVDFVGREDIDGSRGLADFERLRVSGDDDVLGDLRDFEPDLQGVGVCGSQQKREFAWDEGVAFETNPIAAGRKN